MQLKEYMNQAFPGVTLSPTYYLSGKIIYNLISEKIKIKL